MAAEFGAASDKFGPLVQSKDALLRVASELDAKRGAYETITLRGGETARLTAGWTRARLGVRSRGGDVYEQHCHDVFEGLRVAVTARSTDEGWELETYMTRGGLKNDSAVLAREPDWFGQDELGSHITLSAKEVGLSPSRDQECWIASIKGQYDEEYVQVLVCARIVYFE